MLAKNGHNDVVKLLLNNSERHIDLNARDEHGRTALMFACGNGHNDVVKLLLENSKRNIDLNVRSNTGKTAIIYACENGHKDVVKLLLENSVAMILTSQLDAIEELNNDMRVFIDKQQRKR